MKFTDFQYVTATLKRVIVATSFVFAALFAYSQTPFNGMSVQEVTIPAGPLGTINADLGTTGSARCWRVYICMDDPDWELQALFGDQTYPWELTVTSSFYQHPAGSPIAAGINPAFYGPAPELEFDSWFTIGASSSPSSVSYIQSPATPLTDFEAGNGFLENTFTGTPVFGIWLPPLSEGRPDADNKLLVAQFTTDGIFTGTFNFQFRRLNPDGTVYNTPLTDQDITGVYVDGTPGVEMDICPIVFLPVELLNFSAKPINDQVNLNWTTASETNNDYFTVQRSLDRENWEDVVKMDGAGTTELTNIYATIDTDPYRGVSYYRLLQTDFNGETTESNDVAVRFDDLANLEIYPNPAKDLFYLGGDLENVSIITLRDSRGRVVFSNQFNQQVEWSLSDYNLETGLYVVEFELRNGAKKSEKLIIK